jgi:hypothetical protein
MRKGPEPMASEPFPCPLVHPVDWITAVTTDHSPKPAERNYPVSRPPKGGDDPRFSMGLVFDLVRVLTSHDYPAATGGDLVGFQVALFSFIYGPEDKSNYGALSEIPECTCAEPSGLSGCEQHMPVKLREKPHRNADYGQTGPSAIDESRPVQARRAAATGDPLHRFEKLQDPQTDQPPACEVHPENRLECLACGEIRRAFYVELGQRMAEGAHDQ